MVRLEEVEDETFVDKPESTKYDALIEDDADYTDTGKAHPTHPLKVPVASISRVNSSPMVTHH